MALREKRSVESHLNSVDYEFKGYMPEKEALLFVNFIKEVNAGAEENETPIVHLKMMDNVFNKERRCAILCHRGIGKTTVFAEYLILFNAAFGYFPGFGKVNLLLYVTDSIENGVKNLRRNVEYRYQESEFLQKLIPNQKITVGTEGTGMVGLDKYEEQVAGGRKFTDIRLEFMNNKGHRTIVKGYGAKALSLGSLLHTDTGTITIGDCKVGDRIFGADGKLATIVEKSEVFHKPMYSIQLEDMRTLVVSEDHINSIVHKENVNNKATYTKKDLYTSELLDLPLLHSRKRTRRNGVDYVSNENLLFIENCDPIEYSEKTFDVDPYTLGLVLGDGSIKSSCNTVVITGHKDDWVEYEEAIPYQLGSVQVDKRNTNVVTRTIKGIGSMVKGKGLGHGDNKFIPDSYFVGSIEQRLELLRGLLDSDGSIQKNGRMDFCSNSENLVDDVSKLVNSLGGTAKKRKVRKAFRIEIWIGLNPFKLSRKAVRFTGRSKNLVAIESITRCQDEPSQCIAIDNESHQFVTEDYIRTHNTGVRGAKELGQRPTIAILDDLVSDEDARSDTIIDTIENTVYKAVSKALHPQKQKMVWLGTPFNAKDPLYKAVESGAWIVSVYPICERFPVSKEEFRGSWEDRFTYEYVKAEYDEAIALGKPENFNQELMLRIMSDEDRLVQDDDLVWYERTKVLENKGNYNFYITTDFATSEKKSADFSVISVWAYNNNGDWLLVDGVCKKQLMDANVDDLFRLCSIYKPLSVGVEITGQQGGFIQWIKGEMINRNIYFSFAGKGNTEGIRPSTDKITRFNQVLPMFKTKKIWFPQELKETPYMNELLDELMYVSKAGFKSKHDDVADTVSMLSELTAYKPGNEVTYQVGNDGVWEEVEDYKEGKSPYVF